MTGRKSHFRNTLYCWFSLTLSVVAAQPAWAQERSSAEQFITSADVFARVEVLRDELSLIRREIGAPPPVYIDIAVQDADPRETYFHAYTLSDKAHRQAFEFTGRPERALDILLSPQTTPVDVYAVVSEALESIRTTKRALGIEEESNEEPGDPRTTSSEVLRSIIQANHELNDLLYRGYSPLDTYEQVATAINFATRLLEQFPGSTPVPDVPPFERRKTPADVFNRLVHLFEYIRQIALVSGESTLRLKVRAGNPYSVTPSDTYDAARIVFAELAYFYSLLPDPAPVDEPQYPSHRLLPSHVYQQVGALEAQLTQLTALTKKKPGWLGKNKP